MEENKKIKIFNFIKKHQVVFILLALIILNIFLRSFLYFLPITEDITHHYLDVTLALSLKQEFKEEYPDLTFMHIKELVSQEKEKRYKKYETRNFEKANQQFQDLFRRDDGFPYFIGMDPYLWYRLAKNVEDHGYPGDYIAEEDIQSYELIKKGSQVNSYTLAPLGKNIGSINFFPYFIYYWSLLFKPFGIDMFASMFFIPIFWTTLAIFPLFFIVRRIAGNMGGFIAASILITNQIFLMRSTGGFPDTDCLQVTMPLFIIWFLIEAHYTDNTKYKILFSAFSALTVVLYAYSWLGWFYIYDVILFFFVVYGLILFFTKKDLKDHFKISICFIVISIPLLILLRGITSVPYLIIAPLSGFAGLKTTTLSNLLWGIWPNALTAVREQQIVPFDVTLSTFGPKILFLFLILGIVYLIIRKHWKYLIISLPWFIITFYATTKGLKYLTLTLPAFAILIGIGAGCLFRQLIRQMGEYFKIDKKRLGFALTILILIMLFPLLSGSYNFIKRGAPIIHDVWWNGLKKIDREAPENVIIASWWDYGHFFTSIGNRPTIFDGTSQQHPPSYWIGKVLLTPDEEEAITILRMLNCRGNKAYEKIREEFDGDELKSFNVINKMIHMEKEDAREYLKSIIPEEIADGIIDEYMFCENPPETYLVTSEDMVGNAGVWAHFGSWNFTKAKMFNDFQQGRDEEFFKEYYNMTDSEVNKLFNELFFLEPGKGTDWIAPWPHYKENQGHCDHHKDTTVCENLINEQPIFLEFNYTSMKSRILNAEDDINLYSVIVSVNDTIYEIISENEMILPLTMSISLYDNNRLSSPQLGMSLFNRLINYEGIGLEHFEPFYINKTIVNERVYIWKVK